MLYADGACLHEKGAQLFSGKKYSYLPDEPVYMLEEPGYMSEEH
jgi:hypothetical protein